VSSDLLLAGFALLGMRLTTFLADTYFFVPDRELHGDGNDGNTTVTAVVPQ